MQKQLKNLVIGLVCVPIFFIQIPLFSQTPSCGPISIETAESFYNLGRFENCIQLLNGCLQKNGFEFNEKVQAYRFLTMSYLAVDSIDQADKIIAQLLSLQDNFEPLSNDPYRFRIEVIYQRQLLRASLISSVSKKAENIKLAPATIQLITDEDIKLRGYQDIESIMYDIPGFHVSRDFGITFSTLYQRGYRSATMTERTLFLVDGVDSNELWTNSAFITKQLPITRVKRVEIIYGPASTIYGANAFVGVVNIVTKGEDDYFPADRQELEGKRKNLAVEAVMGYSSLNTRYADVTIAQRGKKNTYFSLTSRIYKSDGLDLSTDSNWDGMLNYSSNTYLTNFTLNKPTKETIANFTKADPTRKYFTLAADSSKITPTSLALSTAAQLDEKGYKQTYNGVDPSKFSNPINNFYVAGRARLADFNVGFEFWNKNEGAVGTYIDRNASPNAALTNWQVRQYYVFIKYQKRLSEKLSFDNFTYYRGTDFGDNSRVTNYRSYGNKALPFFNLVSSNGTQFGTFATTYYGQIATQFKSEFKLQYQIADNLDLNSGFEFRTNAMQGDYVKGNKFPAIQYGLVTNGSTLPGGNNFNAYTASAYSQLSYTNLAKHVNVSLAYRWDYNVIPKEQAGFGNILNPRFALVYYPGKFIFKTYYSEAFMDASAFNKFAISASRLVNNPGLKPEKVNNFEFSAQYTFDKTQPNSYVEFAFYNAFYSNTLALINYQIPGTTTITNRFEALGKATISGLQVSGNYQASKRLQFFGNMTMTNPAVILQSAKTLSDSLTKRTGDIASFSANAGLNLSLLPSNRLNFHMRMNYIGEKPTGKLTSISDNPLTKIDSYMLLHLNIGYQFSDQFRLQVGCTNLMDTEYRSPGIRLADNITNPPSIPQYGRMFQVQLFYQVVK
jgi:outer membrane receptor for ferrienterochelin and colicin